jgi:hypothetical protein
LMGKDIGGFADKWNVIRLAVSPQACRWPRILA